MLTVDTLKICKKEFYLNSNRQDAVSKFLGRKGKIDTKLEWWKKICDPASPIKERRKYLDMMVEYNVDDVEELILNYRDIRPYATNHPAFTLINGIEEGCPRGCGDTLELNNRKHHKATTRKYDMFQCPPRS